MKEGLKHNLSRENYKIDKENNCILFLGDHDITIEEILLITNITTNDILYNPHCDGLGGVLSLKGHLIFEKALSDATQNSDDLMVIIQKSVNLTGKLVELKINNIYNQMTHGDIIRESDI